MAATDKEVAAAAGPSADPAVDLAGRLQLDEVAASGAVAAETVEAIPVDLAALGGLDELPVSSPSFCRLKSLPAHGSHTHGAHAAHDARRNFARFAALGDLKKSALRQRTVMALCWGRVLGPRAGTVCALRSIPTSLPQRSCLCALG